MAIITISRGTFSGGRDLAECVAEKLGYPCLGREGVLEAASAYGISREKLASALEHPPSFWERLTGLRLQYLNYVRAALCDHAPEGNLVYHGHAGHLLLPETCHVIRVRVIADMDYRINAAMKREKLSRDEAIAYIKKVDRERALWTRFLYGVDWQDPGLYDLVVNVQRLGIAAACDALAAMARLEAFRPTDQALKAMRDLALGHKVWVELARNPDTRAAELEVLADDGVVTITGTTHFPSVYEAIPAVAARVEGVKRVRSLVVETSKTYP